MKRHIIAASLLVAGLFAVPASQALAAGPDSARPSVVIVHGAFADGSDWAKVVALLQAKGVQVQAVQNPLESLAGDVAAANRAIDNQPGKVVPVSYTHLSLRLFMLSQPSDTSSAAPTLGWVAMAVIMRSA